MRNARQSDIAQCAETKPFHRPPQEFVHATAALARGAWPRQKRRAFFCGIRLRDALDNEQGIDCLFTESVDSTNHAGEGSGDPSVTPLMTPESLENDEGDPDEGTFHHSENSMVSLPSDTPEPPWLHDENYMEVLNGNSALTGVTSIINAIEPSPTPTPCHHRALITSGRAAYHPQLASVAM